MSQQRKHGRNKRIVMIVAVLAVAGAAAPAAVHAQPLPPSVEQEFDRIVEFNYRGSAQPSPPTCTGVCTDLRAAELRAAPIDEVTRDARRIRVATGVNPALRRLGTIGLALGTFELGWKIGTGINAKFLKIGIPEGMEAGTVYSYARWSELQWHTANSLSFGDARWPEEDGWVGYFWNYWNNRDNRWFDAPCQYSGIVPPTPLTIRGPIAVGSVCGVPGQPNAALAVRYAYLPENGLNPAGPIEDYTGQPFRVETPSPADPGKTTVADALRELLESGQFPKLRQQIEFELGEPDVCDPVDQNVCNPPATDEDNQRKCEVSAPEEADPDNTISTDFNEPAQYQVVTPFTRKTEDGGQTGTAMKVGWTKPAKSKKRWMGWGWRHVAAKHGWGADDILATQAALLTTPEPTNNGQVLKYRGPEYTRNGAICERVVTVAPVALHNVDEPEPKEIITSYGSYVRPS